MNTTITITPAPCHNCGVCPPINIIQNGAYCGSCGSPSVGHCGSPSFGCSGSPSKLSCKICSSLPSLVSMVPVVPAAPLPEIQVKIGTKAALVYKKPAKLGGGSATIFLMNPIDATIPQGTIVSIGKNEYVPVDHFYSNLGDVPEQPASRVMKKVIPVGTPVWWDSVPTTIPAGIEIEVEIPANCPIILPVHTLLQQPDSEVELDLRRDFEAEIVSRNSGKDKSKEKK